MLRNRRVVALGTLGCLYASTALAAFWVDNEPWNLIASPGFERGAASLRLPAVDPFPLVAGGWGARGGASGSISTPSRDAFEGNRSLQIDSSFEAPVYLLQDVPVATRSFRFQLAVRRLRGRQSIKLLEGWDRMAPETAPAVLSLEMGANGLRVTTASGSWLLDAPFAARGWVLLEVIADARDQQLQIRVNERLVATLPGIPERPPQTLVIGGAGNRGRSRYRYDAFRLLRLAELELADLRRSARQWVPAADLPYVMDRLDAAAQALSRGADNLAAPELRATLRLLERSSAEPQPLAEMMASTEAVIRLVSGS